ncbi:MORN repeat-containing protein 3 [Selaginella moellendorffii]|nr:MORN repeat-containing protein 3 [Selaginella moellendorffii]|eukprot:XP_002964641.2 MORN repeat-containing protein 3 [Selaginella moellendorffii]
MKMLPSPTISSDRGKGKKEEKKERLWQINDRLADKHGYCHNVYWVHGDVYRGCWDKNKRDGAGIHNYKTGIRYEGDWKNGKRDGYGTLYLADEEVDKYRVVYKGHYKEGKKHGPGLLHGAFGETYDGNFAYGLRNGVGKQFYRCQLTNGFHVYHGQWVNDKREGVGLLKMVNGDLYKGSFVNDMKEGKGIYYYGDKCSKYEGLWKKDVAICGTYSNTSEQDKHIPYLEIENACSFAPELITQHLAGEEVRTHSFSSLGHADRMKLTPRQISSI